MEALVCGTMHGFLLDYCSLSTRAVSYTHLDGKHRHIAALLDSLAELAI